MRIDKYLWCVRVYKTRSIATQEVKKGHVKIADKSVKASREVYPQDEITVRKNQINYQFEVLDLPKNRVGAKLVNLYLIDKTPKEAFDHLDLLKFSKEYYRAKGTGRPTKKDRRELDQYKEQDSPNDNKTTDGK